MLPEDRRVEAERRWIRDHEPDYGEPRLRPRSEGRDGRRRTPRRGGAVLGSLLAAAILLALVWIVPLVLAWSAFRGEAPFEAMTPIPAGLLALLLAVLGLGGLVLSWGVAMARGWVFALDAFLALAVAAAAAWPPALDAGVWPAWAPLVLWAAALVLGTFGFWLAARRAEERRRIAGPGRPA